MEIVIPFVLGMMCGASVGLVFAALCITAGRADRHQEMRQRMKDLINEER